VPLARDLLGHTATAMSDLEAVAVSKGPGSYTGLRIGVSTAKGLVAATGAALIGVPTLEALAASAAPQAAPGDLIIATLHARRQEVYAAGYRVARPAAAPRTTDAEDEAGAPDGPAALETAAETAALETDMLPEWLGEAADAATCWVVGSGAEQAVPVLQAHADTVRLPPPPRHTPQPGWVARQALRRWQSAQTDDPAAFEPLYVKPFRATPPDETPLERVADA
jgi:tRNA threonylcarbamoyladenosine biosynthesis protein TsaB